MNRIAICKKCGAVAHEKDVFNTIIGKQRCCWCDADYSFVFIDKTRIELEEKYDPEFKRICEEQGKYFPECAVSMLDEQIRKDYFYGKLDQEVSQSAVNKREYRSTKEYQNEMYRKMKEAEQRRLDQQKAINNPKCPCCGSTAVTAGQRGYSFFSGFFGSNRTMNRCANCGHKWYPGR